MISKYLKYYKQAIAAGILLVVFVGFFIASRNIQTMAKMSVDAKFLPTLITGLGAILSIINLISGIAEGKKNWALATETGEINIEKTPEEKIGAIKAALTVGVLIVYLILIKPLGFIIASILYLVAQICILSPNKLTKKSIIIYAIIAIVVSVACYIFFRQVFHLMLPRGIMPF